MMEAFFFWGVWIAREVFAVEGSCHYIIGHSERISYHTEGDIRGGRPIVEFWRGTELFQRKMRVPQSPFEGKGRRPVLGDKCLPFMLLQLELPCQLNAKERRHPVLIASAPPQQYVWIKTVALAILRLAIRKAGKSAETAPVGGGRVSLISAGECLSYEC